MESADKSEILAYMRQHRYVVVATTAADGAPQAALVNIATTDALEIMFDTLSTSRKHANLERDRRIAVTFSGPAEQTLQLEGVAVPVSLTDTADYEHMEAYYAIWPEARKQAKTPDVVYWRVEPRWARYTDYLRGPLVLEVTW